MSEFGRTVYIFLGDIPIAGPMPELRAYGLLAEAQDDSVFNAIRHGGYSVLTVGEFEGVCGTSGCTGRATHINAWELRDQFYRCESCHAQIVRVLPVFDEDGALSREDYDSLVTTVLAMDQAALTLIKDRFTS